MDIRTIGSVAVITEEQYRELVGECPWWAENPTQELMDKVLPHLTPRQRCQLEWAGGKVALLSTWVPFMTHVAEFTPASNGRPAVLYVTPYELKNQFYFSTARFEEEAQAFMARHWLHAMAAD